MYIGLVGPIASGKGIAAEYFKSQGFDNISLSQILREIAKKEGVPIERKALQDIGNKMREKHGVGYLGAEACTKIKVFGMKNAVIDGIRNPGEIKELRKNFRSFVLISVDADVNKRHIWALARNKDSDPKTKEGFMIADARDLGRGEKNTGQAVEKCMAMANYKIINDGTKQDLMEKVNSLHNLIKTHANRFSE